MQHLEPASKHTSVFFWFLGSYYSTIEPIKYVLYPQVLLNSLVSMLEVRL